MNRIRTVVRGDRKRARAAEATFVAACTAAGLAAGSTIENPDVIVAIGGDGTVLGAAAVSMEHNVPVCGVNVGRVGYLAEFEPSEIDDLVAAIAEESYRVVEHGTVSVTMGSVSGIAINDVVVEKVMSQRIIEIAVTINGESLATYRADGVIAATPLGSTAYSLSAGGPIVSPDLDALILTPIAPHSLLSRAIVLAPDTVVEIVVKGNRPATINVDGRNLSPIQRDVPIVIRRGESNVRFLSLNRHPFPQAVREHFGLDRA